MIETHRVEPGATLDLSEIATRGDAFHDDRDAAEREFQELRLELAELQHALYAEGRQKLLVVLQAMDAGGKDSTVRKVFKGVNPQGVRVTSFKVPSAEERAHDFLWRVHKAAPRAGNIAVFNRSHYEDVLVVRVAGLAPEEVWRPRYELINNFERLLGAEGTRVLKFFLHISLEEQKERFQDRLDKPHKRWKFASGDLDKRKQWPDYMAAYEDALSHCSTERAPWWVIPADQKWYRNLAISRVLVATLREMNPRFPEPEEGLDGIRIE
jgi:PPK2 family polyphosphate:nucleotide phosphotransferase